MDKPIERLGRDIQGLVAKAARHAAVNVMNDLAEAGPLWSGRFQDSWVATSAQGSTGSGSYPYSLSSVPEIKLSLAEARSALLPGGLTYTIKNTQPYAAYALDLQEGEFRGVDFAGPPEGKIFAQGTRGNGKPPAIRGDVKTDAEGKAISTAPMDWYTTYINGGGMAKALELGVRTVFK